MYRKKVNEIVIEKVNEGEKSHGKSKVFPKQDVKTNA